MSRKESNTISNFAGLKKLEEEYRIATRELSRVKSNAKRRKLKESVDDLKMRLGWELLDHGKFDHGLALFETLSWRIHGEMKCNGMARALTAMERYDEARQIIEKGLKRFSNSEALWVAMGALHGCLGDDFEALKCFETAIQFASRDDSAGLYDKALTLMKLGAYRDAVSILDDLIKINPEDPRYFSDKGSCALDMGYPQEALQHYQQAMKVWRQSTDTYTGVCIYSGMCAAYSELGMINESMEIALEGLKKFPEDDAILYQNVGASFYQKGWKREAIEVLKKGVEKFPDDEEIKTFLKDVEEDLDDPDQGDKPPLLGVLLFMAILSKRMRKR